VALASVSTRRRGAVAKTTAAAVSASTRGRGANAKIVEKSPQGQDSRKRKGKEKIVGG